MRPSSLRARLLLLVLLAFLPAFGLILYNGLWEERRGQVARIEADAFWLARLAAEGHERTVEEAKQLLAGLEYLEGVRRRRVHAGRTVICLDVLVADPRARQVAPLLEALRRAGFDPRGRYAASVTDFAGALDGRLGRVLRLSRAPGFRCPRRPPTRVPGGGAEADEAPPGRHSGARRRTASRRARARIPSEMTTSRTSGSRAQQAQRPPRLRRGAHAGGLAGPPALRDRPRLPGPDRGGGVPDAAAHAHFGGVIP